jgi:hypothetical protein
MPVSYGTLQLNSRSQAFINPNSCPKLIPFLKAILADRKVTGRQ